MSIRWKPSNYNLFDLVVLEENGEVYEIQGIDSPSPNVFCYRIVMISNMHLPSDQLEKLNVPEDFLSLSIDGKRPENPIAYHGEIGPPMLRKKTRHGPKV